MATVIISTDPTFYTGGPHLKFLKDAGLDVRFPSRVPLVTEAETIEAHAEATAVIAGGDPFSEAVLEKLPQLRVISRFGVGYDRVDVEAATKRSIVLTITPNANHEAVAEHAFALMLALARSINANDRDIKNGEWPKHILVPVRGKTLGVIGLGRIGQSVAVRAAAFGMKLLGSDPFADRQIAFKLAVEMVSLDALLSNSDFVTLHAPHIPETEGMINRKTLASMKPGSFLINTARGALVDDEALVSALQSNHLAGAGLDALTVEPPLNNSPYFGLKNVIISPHIAATDSRGIFEMARDAAQNVIDLSHGNWPDDSVINPSVKDNWSWTK